MSRRDMPPKWLWLVGLLVLVKAALVLCLGDVFFYGEELEKGVAAKAMIDGLAVPHHQLAYHYYEGGGFVVSHLVALAFLSVGQNLLAHKLVALGFQIAILLAGCHLTRRFYGSAASLWFGVLFVFGPESYQKLSLINLGIHFEACLFLFGVLGLGAHLLFGEASRKREWFLLGLVTGAGLYFSYQTALPAAWVALLLLVFRTRALFGIRGFWAILGTLLGAAPLIVMYSLVGDAVFNIHGVAVTGADQGPSNLELVRAFLRSIFVEGALGELGTPIAWGSLWVAACIWLLRRPAAASSARRQRTIYLLGYMALFLVVYLASGFVQGAVYHHFLLLRLVPLWMMVLVLVAGALGELSSDERAIPRKAGFAAGAALVGFGAFGSASIAAAGQPAQLSTNWSTLTQFKGYSYGEYFLKVMQHFDGSREDKLRLIEGFDESQTGWLRAGAVQSLFGDKFLKEVDGDLGQALERAQQSLGRACGEDEGRLAQYELGLGLLQVVGQGWNRQAAFERALSLPATERPGSLEALGRFGGRGYATPESIEREVARTRGRENTEPFLRGLGRWAFELHRLKPQAFRESMQAYSAAVREPMLEGFEAERRWHLTE
ncbi:MAG: hypothetical protein ACI9F9_002649 [Candidatus Paceibacteria bacterium]|jgi:hypothetical protein